MEQTISGPVAVLGAGIMGHGIAYAAAAGGFETRLYDPAPDALARACERIRAIVDAGVARGSMPADAAPAVVGRVSTCASVERAVADAGFVIECAPEQMSLKLDLLAAVERAAPAAACLATNTSALAIGELAAALGDPGRLAGMHFFNPVHKMRLVEVVAAPETRPDTLRTVEGVARRMGKETVLVRDSPGFVTSRINALIGNEAFYMLEAGIASAPDIDRALKLGLNHPMGPFELVDLVGLDTRLSVLEFLHATLGGKYRPCPLLVQYVREGRLGRKVGRGVYEYPAAAGSGSGT